MISKSFQKLTTASYEILLAHAEFLLGKIQHKLEYDPLAFVIFDMKFSDDVLSKNSQTS